MSISLSNFWARGRSVATLLRPNRFDKLTPEGRARERVQRAAMTSVAAAASKAVSMVSILISVPLTVHYLGKERYGLWMTISQVIVMLGFADLGMGNGIMNLVSAANGKDDERAAKRCISSGFIMLTGIGALMLAAFYTAYPFVAWGRIFNVLSPLAKSEAGSATAVLLTCTALSLPLGIVQRVQTGYQEGYQTNLWSCLGSILGLCGLLIVVHVHAGLPWLVLAASGAPVLTTLLNFAAFFFYSRRGLLPSLAYWSREAAGQVVRMGVLFFILQLALAFAVTSDNLVAAHVIGAKSVSDYAVVAKMFSVLVVLSNMIIFPLWPAYGEAFARGDLAWVRKTLGKTMRLGALAAAVPAAALVLAGPLVLKLWVGSSVTASFMLLLGFGIWTVLNTLGNAMAMFLNGAHVVLYQVIWTVLFAGVALCAKILLARSMGLPGIIWGMALSYLLLLAIPYLVFTLKFLRQPAAVAAA